MSDPPCWTRIGWWQRRWRAGRARCGPPGAAGWAAIPPRAELHWGVNNSRTKATRIGGRTRRKTRAGLTAADSSRGPSANLRDTDYAGLCERPIPGAAISLLKAGSCSRPPRPRQSAAASPRWTRQAGRGRPFRQAAGSSNGTARGAGDRELRFLSGPRPGMGRRGATSAGPA